MNFSPDDPKLTAYALGELPANEAAEVEVAIKNSPELQTAIAEIRQTAELLESEFAAEPGPLLSETAKASVVAAIQPENVISLPNRSFWRTAGLSAIAAGILCLLAWQFWAPKSNEPTFSVAKAQRVEALDERRSISPAAPSVPKDAPAEIPASRPQTAATPKRQDGKAVATLQKREPEVMQLVEAVPVERKKAKQNLETLAASDSVSQVAGQPGKFDNFFKEKAPEASGQSVAASAPVATTPASTAPESSVDKLYARSRAADTRFSTPAAQGAPNQNRPMSYAFDDAYLKQSGAKSESIDRPKIKVTGFFGESDYEIERNFDSLQGAPPKLDLAEKELAELKLRYTDRHPSIVRQKEKIQALRRQSSNETARYPKYTENEFESTVENPLSTFSIDVDTASYANLRRFLNEGRMPPRAAVRVEEMINYFSYDYPEPKDGEPFSVNMEVASCPWQPEHQLLRVGLKGKEMAQNKRPPSNFVFLIDVSGSMSPEERLPLIKQSLRVLVKRMTENDRIAIVVYASSSGVVLESTSCGNKEKILEALDRLEAGGSTDGGQGIQRAYSLAEGHFIKGGVNRVILCTDGDFNVGITDQAELISLIERKAKSGVFLSVLGVGTDNYKDALMQKLADKGNGNYHYLDSVEEAHKVLVEQMNGTLVTIAKDVKIQIEFNPSKVSSYRLIGYEKRILAAEDFNNDKKDAGEIGAGHTVTALYEIVPARVELAAARVAVDDLKYQRRQPVSKQQRVTVVNASNEMLTLKLRYKKPDGDKSVLREHTLPDAKKKYSQASSDFRFAAAVASFGMVMKHSEHKGEANFGSVLELAKEAKGDDKEGYRSEFINLVKKARELKPGGEGDEN